jgi:hypothetical protein
MDKFMKFWAKYGYMFHLVSAILLFIGGADIWLGVTNLFLAIPLFFESQNKKYE